MLNNISVSLMLYVFHCGVITLGTGCTFGVPNFANPVKAAGNDASNWVLLKNGLLSSRIEDVSLILVGD